jgi:hypothetical protein
MLAIIGWLTTIAVTLYGVYSCLTPSGKTYVQNFILNVYSGAVANIQPLLKLLGVQLQPIEQSIVSAFQEYGPAIAADLNAPLTALARTTLTATTAAVAALPASSPDNALDAAAQAFAAAFGNGLSSAGVAALFEAIFPEKLNTLNGLAPMIAKMAGFDEIAAAVLEPLYKNAFGRSLEYQYRSTFKPELPDEDDAVTWHSRGLLTDAQLQTIFGYSGLKPEYEAPFVASAYRAVQPRMFASLLADQVFPTAQVQSALQFAGLRPADITFLLSALEFNSTKDVRAQYLSALIRSVELGTDTPANLSAAMASMGYSTDAQNYVQLTVAERKLLQLAELYRKSISEGYAYGTISDGDYVPSLEAIGIGSADAEAHYAVDSIKKTGKELTAETRAAARLASQRTSAAVKAAIAEFRTGTLTSIELGAALVAAGLDPLIATYATTAQVARLSGPQVFIYGQELTREAAQSLRLKVSALGKQVTAGLTSVADALTLLADNGVPDNIAKELVAAWAATKTPAADVGTLEPL